MAAIKAKAVATILRDCDEDAASCDERAADDQAIMRRKVAI
jgi:hypothetical protein